jgi:CelD/BcsL family acetyltransferase involved in cellulose biosynthesis
MMPVAEAVPSTVAPLETLSERVGDRRALSALRPQWNDLLRASAANSPFLTWEWLDTWSKHLCDAAALRILCVHAGGELIAVAPFMSSHGPFGWLPRLEFLGSGYAGSDYLDLVARRGCEADAVDAIARALTAQSLALRLDHVSEASLASRLASRLESAGWTASILPGGVCPIIPLARHTWDSYLATLGSAHRANVRRRLRTLERQFQTRFEQVTTESERSEALLALCAFHERRFDTRGGSTAFITPALRAFQDEATRRALECGWLRMYVLRLDGAPAGVMYGFFYDRQFYFYQHGFDDRYERYSIGLVLMALTIRAAIAEDAQTFDMLWGTEPYKWLWAREANTLRQINLFPPHLGGRIQRGAVTARRTLGRLARRIRTPGDTRGA